MSRISDKNHLKNLSLDVMKHRYFGIKVNVRSGIVLKYYPIINNLIKEGKLILEEKVRQSYKNHKTVIHPSPDKNFVPICPCCKNIIKLLPETSLQEHKKDCRLKVYGAYQDRFYK